MIQRIQSVYLALASVLNLGVYFTPVYDKAMQDPEAWIGYGLAVALVIPIILSLVTIFLYEDRMKQIRLLKADLIVQVIALGFASGVLLSLGGIGTYLWDEALGTLMIVIALLLMVLAIRSIRKDEELVRSMDRIR